MRLVTKASDLASLIGECDIGCVDHVSLAPEMEPGYGGRLSKIAKALSEPSAGYEIHALATLATIDAEIKALRDAECRIMLAINETMTAEECADCHGLHRRAYLHLIPLTGYFSITKEPTLFIHRLSSPCETRLLADTAAGVDLTSFHAWWSEQHVRSSSGSRIYWCRECCSEVFNKGQSQSA